MALSTETLKFLLQQLKKGSYEGFVSVSSQIFNYLKNEVQDNPVYLKYEAESSMWIEWLKTEGYIDLKLPETLDDSKLLAYAAYKELSILVKQDSENFIVNLFSQNRIVDNYHQFNQTFLDYFTNALDDIIIANPEIQDSTAEKIYGTKVFIIHGHDTHLKETVQLLMQRAGVKSLVLHEAADKGRHTLDKLIEETKEAAYAIALLTPDDLLIKGNSRARQNVILEIGYFLGQLGKSRVRMVVKEGTEIPSDLHGILYERFDNEGAWKVKLIKEMQAVGIFVDIKAVIESL